MRKRTVSIAAALAGFQRETLIVNHDQRTVALDHRSRRREVERHHRNALLIDVVPDVELGPIRQRKNADAFAAALAAIIDAPWLGALALRIPQMIGAAKGEHTFLGTRCLLVAAGAAECGIEAIMIERLPQRLRLHHVGMQFRSAGYRIDAASEALFVDMHDQIEAELAGAGIAKRDHLAELPGGVDVQQRKRRLRRVERLERQMQQDRRILADRIEHHWIFRLGHRLANDVDALGFQLFEMAEPRRRRHVRDRIVGAINGWRVSVGHGRVRVRACEAARVMRPSAPTCSPHSFFSSCSHHQRPARSGSPGCSARVHGAQPIERKPRSCNLL